MIYSKIKVRSEERELPKLTYHQDIYTYQIDFAHHVSNIVYIEWMEIGRIKILEYIGLGIDILEKRNVTPVLIKTEINYRKPLYINDKVEINVWVSNLRNASADLMFDFYNDKKELVAQGKQTGLFIDISTKRPHRINAEEREAFSKLLIEDLN